MKEQIKKLLQKIICSAYEVNSTTKHDVFLNFSGHVNVVDVYYYENGFSKNKEHICLADFLKLEGKECVQELTEALEKLEKLK